jgi:dephospho-CoA kinase
MRIIGLTGGIACGKSTISAMLRELGAVIIDADQLARKIVEPDKPAWQEIVAWLGDEILCPDGALDRKKIGEIVFCDPKARERLEKITHPLIKEATSDMLADAERQGYGVAVLDVPLLFETGFDKFADENWVVYVDEATQQARLMERDGLTREQAMARINAQMKLADKVRLADVVIDNSGDVSSTRRQVEAAWKLIS